MITGDIDYKLRIVKTKTLDAGYAIVELELIILYNVASDGHITLSQPLIVEGKVWDWNLQMSKTHTRGVAELCNMFGRQTVIGWLKIFRDSEREETQVLYNAIRLSEDKKRVRKINLDNWKKNLLAH